LRQAELREESKLPMVGADENMTASRGPLEGIRVIDMTVHVSGPMGSMVLGDLGAEVIKIEHPDGDSNRQTGVTFPGGWSTFFLAVNRNKRFVAIDYRTVEGRELIIELVRGADVFVENARPGSWERHGLGYEDLKKINPRLVYASISGFGSQGPMRDWLGLDPLAQAASGIMSITGSAETGPAKIGAAIGDITSGRLLAFGVVTALYHRFRTGVGQKVETSLFAACASILPLREVEYQFTQELPPLNGTAHAQTAPNKVYLTADGRPVIVACHVPSHFKRWLDLAGHPELADDPLFATNVARMANIDATNEMAQKIMSEKTEAEWNELLIGNVPYCPVYNFKELFDHPQMQANGAMIDFEMPDVGTVHTMGSPVQFTAFQPEVHRVPAAVGSDTQAVLTEFGLSQERIDHLRDAGVILVADAQETQDLPV
jgi:crotonobetainyl-CoA:carnitine CoA-transferase CaiB-like acyl-CoA transferase